MSEEELKRNWGKMAPKLKENLGKRADDIHTEVKAKAFALSIKELDALLKALKKK